MSTLLYYDNELLPCRLCGIGFRRSSDRWKKYIRNTTRYRISLGIFFLIYKTIVNFLINEPLNKRTLIINGHVLFTRPSALF